MALQPIDLQALFTQMDKVGKNQAVLREGQQIQDALQQLQSQKKLEENVQSVNETQDMSEEPGKIKDENKGQGSSYTGHGGAKDENGEKDKDDPEEKSTLFRDPALGRNIDILG